MRKAFGYESPAIRALLGGSHGAIWPHWLGSWSSAASLGLSAAVYYAKGTEKQYGSFLMAVWSWLFGVVMSPVASLWRAWLGRGFLHLR